jgi:hypothetical protein
MSWNQRLNLNEPLQTFTPRIFLTVKHEMATRNNTRVLLSQTQELTIFIQGKIENMVTFQKLTRMKRKRIVATKYRSFLLLLKYWLFFTVLFQLLTFRRCRRICYFHH